MSSNCFQFTVPLNENLHVQMETLLNNQPLYLIASVTVTSFAVIFIAAAVKCEDRLKTEMTGSRL